MQEGSFRCDANVSVRRVGDARLGTRCEIKNLNSFRFMAQAIEYEARRQIELLEDGGAVVQETRLFDPDKGETRAMRIKEEAHDYRYFPDPDLLPLVVTEELIEKLRREMPVSQDVLRRRFVHEYGFTDEMADTLVWERSRAEHADQFWGHLLRLTEGIDRMERALAANWAMMEIGAEMNRSGRPAISYPPRDLAMLVARILDKTISHKIAKEVFEAMTKGEGSPDQIIEKRGLRQISDTGSLEKVVDDVISKNAKQVEDYRAGKAKAFNALVGQVMKATQGKANPARVNELLQAKLAR
jgi:aspartyl-tRNA(Asn)/glutamyl-tRNA(Gln) amidotransferase subunit B